MPRKFNKLSSLYSRRKNSGQRRKPIVQISNALSPLQPKPITSSELEEVVQQLAVINQWLSIECHIHNRTFGKEEAFQIQEMIEKVQRKLREMEGLK